MERRQLNLDAPILSARRQSSPSKLRQEVMMKFPLPWNKSERESDKVTKPGAVPFLWEQSPGRPKGSPSRDSGYHWEERYGDHNPLGPQTEPWSLSDHVLLYKTWNDSLSCKDESHSECEDDEYSEAETNCFSSSIKSSGSFRVDEQTRDLMMKRFLPAAKAVVVETPEHVVRKSQATDEQLRVRKQVSEEPMPSPNRYSSSPYPYSYSKLIDHMESQNSVQKCVVPFKKTWKSWGTISQLIAKNSLRLFKPGLGSKPNPLTSEAGRFNGKAKSGPLDKKAFPQLLKKKIYSGLLPGKHGGVEDKVRKESDQFLNNHDRPVRAGMSPMRRYRSGSVSPHRNDLAPKSPLRDYQRPNQSRYCDEPSNSLLRDCRSAIVSPYRNVPKSVLRDYQSANVSPCGNEYPRSPFPSKSSFIPYRSGNLSPFLNEAHFQRGFRSISEEAEDQDADKIAGSQEGCNKPLQEYVWRNQMLCERLSTSGLLVDYAEEKTLYVDTINLPIPKSCRGYKQRNYARHNSSPNASDSEEDEELTSFTFRPTNKVLSSPQTVTSGDRPLKTWESIPEEKRVGGKERYLKSYNKGSDYDLPKSHIPPPLPKMPTQSWLWHATQSAAMGDVSPLSRRTIYSKLGQEGSVIIAPRWESSIKSSNLRRNRLCYSGELTTSQRQSV